MNKFSTLITLLSNLTSPTEARGQIAEYLTHLSPNDQTIACQFIIGKPLDGQKTGFSKKTVVKMVKNYPATDDIPTSNITLEQVFNRYTALVSTGKNKELNLYRSMMDMSDFEKSYYVMILLDKLRNGISMNVISHSLATLYNSTSNEVADLYKKYESVDKVIAILNGERDEIQIGVPVKPQLAKDISKHMNKIKYPVIVEPKYDGVRAQIHYHSDKTVQIFSRSLKDKTVMYPDIVKLIKTINPHPGIYDSEIYGINSDGSPMPFEKFQHRINLENGVDELAKEYPATIRFFDALLVNDFNCMELTQIERTSHLETYFIHNSKNKIIKTEEQLLEYYDECIADGYEGIMIKNPQGLYEPGKGKSEWGNWFKYKPARLTFDVVITGARWGEGKNSDVLSSFDIAVLDKYQTRLGEEGFALIPVGACGGGFNREELIQLTNKITPHPLYDDVSGYQCFEDPIILEVRVDKIMHNDSGGYGMRFPQFVRFRPDKGIKDIDTLEMVKEYV